MQNIINKSYIYIALTYIIVIFLLNDLKTIIEFFTFNLNAPDIQGGELTPIQLRNMFMSSSYDYGIIISQLSSVNSLIVPIICSICIFPYVNYKNRYLKYSIGKGCNYSQLLFKSKIKILTANGILFTSAFLVYILVSYTITGLRYREGATFDPFSDIRIQNEYFMIFIYLIELNIFSFTYGYVILLIADSSLNPIKIAIISILVTYLGSGAVIILFSHTYSLTASIDWLYVANPSWIMLFISYIYIGILYIMVKKFIPKEV